MSARPVHLKPSADRRPADRGATSFFWQGLLILLPVVVLAVVGFCSLRQDRLLAEAEARQVAQRHVDEVARMIWARLLSPDRLKDPRCRIFRVDDHGDLIFPPPVPEAPAPQPMETARLGAQQAALWRKINGTGSDPMTGPDGIKAARELLASDLPSRLAAAASFQLGGLLLFDHQTNEAIRIWLELADGHPHTLSEGGVPLAPLARWKALAAGVPPTAEAVAAFGSNLVYQPTFLTPLLLEKAAQLPRADGSLNPTAHWLEEWKLHEEQRGLAWQYLRSASAKPGSGPLPPLLFWLPRPKVFTAEYLVPYGSAERKQRRRSGSSDQNRVELAFTIPSPPNPGGVKLSGPPASAVVVHTTTTYLLLATRLPAAEGGHWIVCEAMGLFADAYVQPQGDFWTELERNFPPAPPWLGLSIDLGGRTMISDQRLLSIALRPSGKGGGQSFTPTATLLPPEVLATSQQLDRETPVGPGVELLRVNAHLVSPDLLYGRQQARTRLFGLLIGASALAAMVGFVAARRAYHRQQRLAEMKSNFVSSVSHELRAPIASVRLLAESLERGAVTEDARRQEYFRFIVQECRRLGTLIENVLDFARIDQGRKEYEFEPADLTRLVEQTVRLLEPSAVAKEVSLVSEIPDGSSACAVAEVDPQAVQQALVNLIDNALKHSAAGSRVRVGIEPPVSPTERNSAAAVPPCVRLFVEDSGPGIPAEDHERIFERFYRRGSELRRDTQGVGIGLSIVKHIVEAHGGRVIVRSAPGQGSRFTLELPVNATTDAGTKS